MDESQFKQSVYDLVGRIPSGRLMTYGQIAALCGHPRAARQVGQIAHWGPEELPWHRVVNKKGGLASGYTDNSREGQAEQLRAEGVHVSSDYYADIDRLIWWPSSVIPSDPSADGQGSMDEEH